MIASVVFHSCWIVLLWKNLLSIVPIEVCTTWVGIPAIAHVAIATTTLWAQYNGNLSSPIRHGYFCNCLTTVGYLLEVFFRLWTVFPLLLSAGKLNQSFFDRVHDTNYTHSLASFQWSGLSDQRMLRMTKNCLQIWKWCPYKERGVVFAPICATKMRNGPASAYQGCLFYRQPRQPPCARHILNMPAHLPHPTFFASAKPIFKMDCTNR